MANAVEVAGDVAAVSSAVAGLTLVFVGIVSTSFDAYQKTEQSSVRGRYQTRAWVAFVGFAFSIIATVAALLAKLFDQQCVAYGAIASLFIALAFVLFAGLNTVREIR